MLKLDACFRRELEGKLQGAGSGIESGLSGGRCADGYSIRVQLGNNKWWYCDTRRLCQRGRKNLNIVKDIKFAGSASTLNLEQVT